MQNFQKSDNENINNFKLLLRLSDLCNNKKPNCIITEILLLLQYAEV